MMSRKMFAVVMATLLSSANASGQSRGPVSALKGHNSNAPIDWSAERIEVQSDDKRVYFVGSVVAKQAELTLRAPRVTVAYNTDQGLSVQHINAAGGVEITSPTETANGQFAVYDLDRKLITMIGNVSLKQARGILRGQRLTIDLDSGYATLSGGRVSGSFLPRGTTQN